MAEIVATFDTKEKTLAVTKDGKKLKDVSNVEFYTFGDSGGVEIRSVQHDEEESFVTVTKIMASENGVEETETTEAQDKTEDLARALFPHKTL